MAEFPDLSRVEIVFVDSAAALSAARAAGLPPHAEVRSTSPALLLGEVPPALPADASMVSERMRQFCVFSFELASSLARFLADHPILAPLSVAIGQCCRNAETLLYRASCLTDEDFSRPVAAVELEAGNTAARLLYRSSWAELLKDHPDVVIHTIVGDEATIIGAPPPPGLAHRLRNTQLRQLAYRGLQRFWSAAGKMPSRGTVLIAAGKGENELIKETAFDLALKGFALRTVAIAPDASALPEEVVEAVRSAVTDYLMQALAGYLSPKLRGTAARGYVNIILAYLATYQRYREPSRIFLQSQTDKIVALLSNGVVAAPGRALAEACNERGVPVVTFQHGISRELSLQSDRYETMYETVSSDLHFTYNRSNADVTNAGCFNRGRAIAVGMDEIQRKGIRRGGATRRPAATAGAGLWYISTTLYQGELPGLGRGQSDREMAELEIALIDRVFEQLPHNLTYKPYPFARYLDPDPVLERVRRAGNVELYSGRLDLRFLMDRIRVLVTTRATSTLGWCVGSGLPVVFIDLPEQPLTAAARAALEQAIIIVDGRRPQLFSDLTSLLSRPLESIEDEFFAKTEKRRQVIRELFDSGDGSAGRQAARLIMQFGHSSQVAA